MVKKGQFWVVIKVIKKRGLGMVTTVVTMVQLLWLLAWLNRDSFGDYYGG